MAFQKKCSFSFNAQNGPKEKKIVGIHRDPWKSDGVWGSLIFTGTFLGNMLLKLICRTL